MELFKASVAGRFALKRPSAGPPNLILHSIDSGAGALIAIKHILAFNEEPVADREAMKTYL